MDMPATIALLKHQEASLQLDSFDEGVAWTLGAGIRQRAVAEAMPICVDIITWDRRLFSCALPGAADANADWTRRKLATVKYRLRSSYRVLLENKMEKLYSANWGLDAADYALSGGAFPIAVKGAGVIGGIAVSGMHERVDHQLCVEALCQVLKLDSKAFALPPE